MRQVVLASAILLAVQGCDLGHSPANNPNSISPGSIRTDLRLFDTTGTETAAFRRGESFDMRFVLLNLSGIDQTYHYTGTPVVFEVCSTDTTVCTSIDGLLFPQVVLGGVVRNGETFQATWRAPHSIAGGSHIILVPGSYQANIRHGEFFDNVRVGQTASVQLTITP